MSTEQLARVLASMTNRSAHEAPTGRERLITQVAGAVLRDRNAHYGNPEDNFRAIAMIANQVFISGNIPIRINAWAVGVIMEAVKMARMGSSPHVEDHYVDQAGYAACLNDMRPASLEKLREEIFAILPPDMLPDVFNFDPAKEGHPGGPLVVGSSPASDDEEKFESRFGDDRPLENKSSGPIIDNRRAPGQ